ncbi:hypothetical protein [Anaerocolumna jejuensis]|uniref:hypothetical protein n=1 Tax=Anaerocolumna jejuensis TaxID=259063 RepID=UPI003F7BAE59
MKKSNKILAVLLSLVMVMSLFGGCGKNSNGTANKEVSGDVTKEATKAPEDSKASGEVATLTGAIFLESVESNSIKTDPVSNYIRDRFGVQFDVISDCSGNTWNEQFPTQLASDSLPDVFLLVKDAATGYAGTLKKLVDAGAVACLDDYPDLFKDYNSDPVLKAEMDYHRDFVSPDGKAYGFPMYFGESNYAKGLVDTIALRWDAFEAAGKPEFKNFDELADVLKKMQDAAPVDVNGDKPYAISGWFGEAQGWGDWPLIYGYQQMISQSSAAIQYHNEDKISDVNYYADEKSPYYEYLKFMNKAYNLGIIDPDAWTMKWDQYNTEMENGSFLYCPAGWLTDQKNNIITTNLKDENAGFVHFKAPSDYADTYSGGYWDYGTSCTYVISSKCKNIEKAIELLTWISSQEGSLIMENGPEGLAWKMGDDGVPVGNDDYLKMGQFDSEGYKQYGANLYHHFKGYSDATTLSKYGNVTANLRLSDAANQLSIKPYEKSAMEYFGAKSFTDENWLNRANTTFTFNLIDASGAVPDDYAMASANIVNYFFNQQFAAIQAKTDADYQAIVADMIKYAKDGGAEDIQKYYQKKQNEVKDSLSNISSQIGNALAGK